MNDATIRISRYNGLIVVLPLWFFRVRFVGQTDGWIIDVEEMRHATMLEF